MILFLLVGVPLLTGGLLKATSEGYLLEPVGKALKNLPVNLYMPLIGCWPCMSSVWTVLMWLTFVVATPTGWETGAHLWWVILANTFTNSILEYLVYPKSRIKK